MREIVFDTETTGTEPLRGDRIVEIACIELVDRVPTGREFHAYFNPERDMPAAAQAIHGLSGAFLADKPLFADKADALLDFIEDLPLVAHNAHFDFGFLNMELERIGKPTVSLDRMIDTLEIARQKFPGAKRTLDALCTRFGIDISAREKHNALLDTQLLAEVYVELLGGRQRSLVLDVGAPVTDRKTVAVTIERVFRPARPHAPSAPEAAAHAMFIGQMDNPIWSRD